MRPGRRDAITVEISQLHSLTVAEITVSSSTAVCGVSQKPRKVRKSPAGAAD